MQGVIMLSAHSKNQPENTPDNKENSNTEQSNPKEIVITDVKEQGFMLLIVAGSVVASCMGLFLLAIPVGIIAWKRFRTLQPGIRLNLDTGRLSFPGGQIEANSILDYINKDYLLQMFKRFDVPISDIEGMNTSRTERYDEKMQRWIYKYNINLTGSFGSVTLSFSAEGKFNQCLTMLAQANDMGIPVANR